MSLSCAQLFCDPLDYSPPGSSIHGILQARILEWVASHSLLQVIFLTQGSNVQSSALAGGFFSTEPLGKATKLSNGLFPKNYF